MVRELAALQINRLMLGRTRKLCGVLSAVATSVVLLACGGGGGGAEPANAAPQSVLPSAQIVDEDATLTFSSTNGNLVSVNDATAGSLRIALSVSNGTLTLSGVSGLTFEAGKGDGSADAEMVFSGSVSAVNAALNGLVYTPKADYNGPDELQIESSDGSLNDADVLTITANAVNDAPSLTAPGAQQVNEKSSLNFSAVNINSLTVADKDSGTLTVTLRTSHGNLTLSSTVGLTFTAGDGQTDATMAFSGSALAINSSLSGLVYAPNGDYSGADALEVQLSDGSLSDTESVAITVIDTVNGDAPINAGPARSQLTDEHSRLTFSASNNNLIAVSDADSATLQVTLSAANGTLTLAGVNGLTFTSGDGSADATLRFSGSAAAINSALAGLVYQQNVGFRGIDALTIRTSDGGLADAYAVSIFGPDRPSYGRTSSFVFAGADPAQMQAQTLTGCDDAQTQVQNDTTLTVTCVPSSLTVNFAFKDLPGASSATVPISISAPQVTLVTSMGTIVVELAPTEAPITVQNFLWYVNTGYYNQTIFHRVVAGFVDQGGEFAPVDWAQPALIPKSGAKLPAIPLESNRGLPNLAGTIAMARSDAPDSAQSSFFINAVDNSFGNRNNLDYQSPAQPGYAVFGKVISGMPVVTAINGVPKVPNTSFPSTNVVVLSATQTQ